MVKIIRSHLIKCAIHMQYNEDVWIKIIQQPVSEYKTETKSTENL